MGTTRTNAVVGTTNRLSAAGYDAAGNQTTWGTYSYTWDLMGLMKAYQGSGNDWAYAYDADDERMFVYNVVTGQSTFRIRGLDGKVLREVKLTGSTWSWGKDWIYRDGQLLATTASGSVTRYAHADHLGSPRLFTDTAGVAKDKFHYYPFGEQASTAPTAPEALRFTGHERDSGASSGTADDLDYMHARYYHPQLGRFLAVDPIGGTHRFPQTWNRYGYAINNPLKFTDPYGLFPCPGLPEVECHDSVTVVDSRPSFLEIIGIRFDFSFVIARLEEHRVRALQNSIDGRSTAIETSLITGAVTFAELALPNENVYLEVALAGLPPLKLSSKILRNMGARGWTEEMIEQAIREGKTVKAVNKANGNPAVRYVHPGSGQSVVVDQITGDVIHVGGPGFLYGPKSGDIP